MKFEFDGKTPIYLQIINFIKKQIVSNELKGGDKMPSVRELSLQLKVNPNTIQRAYQELEREELAYTQRGMGRFVTKGEETIMNLKKDMAKEVMEIFIKEMQELGFNGAQIVEMVSDEIKREE
ncbi:GntR family transcriptional regulator [Clostridium aestuarii]|uniref:GntR family transcriptional regulator n=1 Tax=Clostridium aestuarii TaxID=338193 RepID=A0ABT4D3C1_9CLOT|nr:GntR family transcriptional regulator [Clostridium aestuarii]MCY6485731.1 GntR family transcriptional regulator [Clostridium aestuarii]